MATNLTIDESYVPGLSAASAIVATNIEPSAGFESQLQALLNSYSWDSFLDTPDFVLAAYINKHLYALREMQERTQTQRDGASK